MAERLSGETFKEKAFQPGKLTLIDFTLTAVYHVREWFRCLQSWKRNTVIRFLLER